MLLDKLGVTKECFHTFGKRCKVCSGIQDPINPLTFITILYIEGVSHEECNFCRKPKTVQYSISYLQRNTTDPSKWQVELMDSQFAKNASDFLLGSSLLSVFQLYILDNLKMFLVRWRQYITILFPWKPCYEIVLSFNLRHMSSLNGQKLGRKKSYHHSSKFKIVYINEFLRVNSMKYIRIF